MKSTWTKDKGENIKERRTDLRREGKGGGSNGIELKSNPIFDDLVTEYLWTCSKKQHYTCQSAGVSVARLSWCPGGLVLLASSPDVSVTVLVFLLL